MKITKEEADWILGWIALLKIVEPKAGFAPQEREFMGRMEKFADA